MFSKLLRAWSTLVTWISFEWLLDRRSNGGAIILLRALLIGTWVYLVAIVLKNWIDPDPKSQINIDSIRTALAGQMEWYGAAIAAVYAALYARFSSQWTYLAGVYNSIKQTEAECHCPAAMAEWKADFMEDAECLHLATKNTIAPIIKGWGNDQNVRVAFLRSTPCGEQRFHRLMRSACEKCAREEHKLLMA